MIIKYNGIQRIICKNLLVTLSDIIWAAIDGINYLLLIIWEREPIYILKIILIRRGKIWEFMKNWV
jgi:hypothetical protein